MTRCLGAIIKEGKKHICQHTLYHCINCGSVGCDQHSFSQCSNQGFLYCKCLVCGTNGQSKIFYSDD
ncbi:hypothetical protein SAMN05216325_1258 [Nitrosomonas marina]|uniref:Uncharacterized protein n=1 Tax=Nitrosomonas marina TaxID=917 RepID=A0A1H8HN39_9PROT|nr:hypothetical protein SAMN05216325_1258 [Nitrosomonas marina]